MRRNAGRGADVIAAMVDRTPHACRQRAARLGVSLYTGGRRRGRLVGQPRDAAWADNAAFDVATDPFSAAAARGGQVLEMRKVLLARPNDRDDERAPLCPACAKAPQTREGLCRACVKERQREAYLAETDRLVREQIRESRT